MTNKAQLIRDNATLRESNEYLHKKLDGFYEERLRKTSSAHRLLDNMLFLDPDLERFRSGEDEYRDWDFARTQQAADFARGHEALHSVEREPDIEIHLTEEPAL